LNASINAYLVCIMYGLRKQNSQKCTCYTLRAVRNTQRIGGSRQWLYCKLLNMPTSSPLLDKLTWHTFMIIFITLHLQLIKSKLMITNQYIWSTSANVFSHCFITMSHIILYQSSNVNTFFWSRIGANLSRQRWSASTWRDGLVH